MERYSFRRRSYHDYRQWTEAELIEEEWLYLCEEMYWVDTYISDGEGGITLV